MCKKNFWKSIFTPEMMLIAIGLIAIHGSSLALLPFSLVAQAQAAPVADVFSPPLGFRDGLSYEPRIMYNNEGQLIENTDYGVKNPDLQGDPALALILTKSITPGRIGIGLTATAPPAQRSLPLPMARSPSPTLI